MILMATSFPVGTCLANFTLAKLPLPMVLSNLYFPIVGSSPTLGLFLVELLLVDSTVLSLLWNKTKKSAWIFHKGEHTFKRRFRLGAVILRKLNNKYD